MGGRARWSMVVLGVVVSSCTIIVTREAHDANDLCAAFIAQGDLAAADTACDHALEYQPRYWDALHNKGLIAQMKGDVATAKRFYIDALRANQDMKSSQNALGVIARDQGDLSGAVERFRAALRVDPTDLVARRNLGDVHLMQKEFAEAEKDFRHCLMMNKDLGEAWVGVGLALEGQRKHDDAATAFERATTLDVNDDRAWLLRAVLAAERSKTDDERDFLERCLLANEKNLECRRRLNELAR